MSVIKTFELTPLSHSFALLSNMFTSNTDNLLWIFYVGVIVFFLSGLVAVALWLLCHHKVEKPRPPTHMN